MAGEQGSLLSQEMLMASASHDMKQYTLPTELPDLSGAEMICIDVETNDPGIRQGLGVGTRRGGYLAGIGVATSDKQWYFPMRHEVGENLDPDNVLRWARDNLCNEKQPKLFTNALYDLDYLYQAGVAVKGTFNDVQVAEPLLDENRSSYALDSLAKDYVGVGKSDDELYQWCAEVYGGAPNRKQAGNIWRAPASLVTPYAHSDCALPFLIFEKQKLLLEQQELTEIYALETNLIPVLLQMRQHGVRFDEKQAHIVAAYMEAELGAAQAQLDTIARQHIDVWAAASVAKAFDACKVGYPRTADGTPSFNQDWLKVKAAAQQEKGAKLAQLVLDTRRWEKANGTFVQGLLKCATNGRIHTEFNQLRKDDSGAVSGRLSSSNPNLQNQPSRDPEMLHLIRSLFIPEDGERFVSLDYSQVEFRVLTHYGKGDSADTARAMYHDDPTTDFHMMVSQLTGMARSAAKNVTFALGYGAGVNKLSAMVGCSKTEAQVMFDTYHTRLPFLRDLATTASRIASNRGYVKTLLGRRRHYNKFESRSYEESKDTPPVSLDEAIALYGVAGFRRAKTHTALNAISQGTAADIAKKSMVDIFKSGICDVTGPPLLVVHDETNFSVPPGQAGDDAIKYIKFLMETTVKLTVPLTVGVSEGKNWGECK